VESCKHTLILEWSNCQHVSLNVNTSWGTTEDHKLITLIHSFCSNFTSTWHQLNYSHFQNSVQIRIHIFTAFSSLIRRVNLGDLHKIEEKSLMKAWHRRETLHLWVFQCANLEWATYVDPPVRRITKTIWQENDYFYWQSQGLQFKVEFFEQTIKPQTVMDPKIPESWWDVVSSHGKISSIKIGDPDPHFCFQLTQRLYIMKRIPNNLNFNVLLNDTLEYVENHKDK